MIDYTAGKVAEICGGRLLSGSPDVRIRHVSFDSRERQGDDLFIPVIGERVDGHRFIRSAFDNGASAALSSREDAWSGEDEGRACILVKDTVEALQALGRYRREHELRMPLVGITGSVGKTTTREMTTAALSAGGRVTASLKNMNSQLGVPVTLCHMDETADYAVAEMGISLPGEMERLCAMVQPDAAVVTNIGVAHIENLGSREGICREKMKITDRLPENGWAILNADEPLLKPYRTEKRFRTLYYGFGADADVRAENITLGESAAFTAVLPAFLCGEEKRIPVQLSVPGEHHVMDALSALSAAAVLGVDPEAAAAGLAAFGGFTGRFERIALGGLLLIDDSYNANPVSMKASLAAFSRMNASRRIAVLADMLELGPDSLKMHRETGEYASGLPIDLFLTLGDAMKEADAALTEAGRTVIHATDLDELVRLTAELSADGDAILLKGSHSMGLERVRRSLEQTAEP